ncbi:MAG TPA: ABC transporter substrate-binding protein [Acidimicrobiales bacterium]|nr:ABC transporter substrate-binding protein [Acidimicrobiales bacterium]
MSANQIRIGVVLLSLAGPVGNQAVGVASPQAQQDMAQALIDDINKAGGVQCRKLVPTYYQVNPVDSVNQHSECLQIVQDGVFAVIDGGGFSYPIASRDCVVQNKIPLYSQVGIVPTEGNQQFYPYLFSPAATYDVDMRDVALGAKARGFFSSSSGFHLLGVLDDDCTPEVNADLDTALSLAGVRPAQISRFVFACPPSGFAPPSAMAQAVEQFKLAGVTNVIPVTGGGSFDTFTKIAQQQDFRPRYAVSDYDGLSSTVESTQGPDPQNFDGAVATIPWRTGQLASGLPADPATQRCNQEMTAHGLPTMAEASAIQGVYCALLTMFTTSAERAPRLTRTALVDGLDASGTVGFSFPFADGTFNRAHKIAGGDYWRPIQWHAGCTCWKVLDPAFQPSFG